jgi:hypothetical protein
MIQGATGVQDLPLQVGNNARELRHGRAGRAAASERSLPAMFARSDPVRPLAGTILRSTVVVCSLSGIGTAAAEDPAPQKPRPIEADYRKHDEFSAIVRARNARQYAITSPQGIHRPVGRRMQRQ